MISLLLPSRRRPNELHRFIDSALDTARESDLIEIIVRIDDDDHSYDEFDCLWGDNVFWIEGPRTVLSENWNEAYRQASGDILGHMGDDIVFRTKGWDEHVHTAFRQYRDRIVFVHGDDGGHPNGKAFGTHGFIHRVWANTVGYFVPPYFSSDWNDTWLNEVANALGRRVYIPILTEHMHPVHGKAEWDITHRERLARGARDNVEQLYKDLEIERLRDIAKLESVIKRST